MNLKQATTSLAISAAIAGGGVVAIDESITDIDIDCNEKQLVLESIETVFKEEPRVKTGLLQTREMVETDKATIKGCQISKVLAVETLDRQTYDIEIIEVNYVEAGLEVYARVWEGRNQIGFGKDGSVDIERFRFINPPVLVEDPQGSIVRTYYDEIDDATTTVRFREDPKEALLIALEDTVRAKTEKSTSSKIIRGKRGQTTTTVYSGTGDGWLTHHFATNSGLSWTNEVNGAGIAGASGDTTENWIRAIGDTGTDQWRYIIRSGYYFDTSAIGSDSISSATFSIYVTSKADTLSASPDVGVVTYSPAGDPIAAGDFDSFGTTDLATPIGYSSISTSAYNDWSLNATGIAAINGAGTTHLGSRNMNYDAADSSPTWAGGSQYVLSARFADNTGTTEDPKLVVEHTASAERRIIKTTEM